MPKHAQSELLNKLESEGKQDFSVDGTERRINRPQDKEEQKKNVLIIVQQGNKKVKL